MPSPPLLSRSILFSALALLIVFSGCRTYGGHDSEERTYAQMQQANERFASDLSRAEGDLEDLQDAARTNDVLQPLAERFETILEQHREHLDTHRDVEASLSPSTDYRTLSRQYRRIITEQRMVRQAYRLTTERVYAVVTDGDVPTQVMREAEAYTEPLIYRQQRNAEPLSMRDALAGRR
ncbi:MAG: hypothetical protein PPP56_07470 [Longimonas sp.]|uniref:hypothetical protein n=1 Tax=Longimonas sp. TaxID=2039626 RepID=UPI00334AEA8B